MMEISASVLVYLFPHLYFSFVSRSFGAIVPGSPGQPQLLRILTWMSFNHYFYFKIEFPPTFIKILFEISNADVIASSASLLNSIHSLSESYQIKSRAYAMILWIDGLTALFCTVASKLECLLCMNAFSVALHFWLSLKHARMTFGIRSPLVAEVVGERGSSIIDEIA